jgi:WD40 repeat protein
LEGHTTWVESAVYNATGSQIVTASWDGTAKVWDVETGKLLHSLRHPPQVNSAHFNATGNQIVTASRNSTVKIWDAFTGKLLKVLRGHYFEIESGVNNVKVIRPPRRNYTHLMRGSGRRGIISATYNAKGNYIISTGTDFRTIIWDVQTRKPLIFLYFCQPIGREDKINRIDFN